MRHPCKKKNERPDSHAWVPAANNGHEGATALESGKRIGSLTQLNMDLGKTSGGLSFSRVGFRVLGLFFLPPLLSLCPLLFIISVSVYTQPNLFVYTALIRSIPERFLWPGAGGRARPAPPTHSILGCKSHNPIPKLMGNFQQKSTGIPGSLLMEEFPAAQYQHS